MATPLTKEQKDSMLNKVQGKAQQAMQPDYGNMYNNILNNFKMQETISDLSPSPSSYGMTGGAAYAGELMKQAGMTSVVSDTMAKMQQAQSKETAVRLQEQGANRRMKAGMIGGTLKGMYGQVSQGTYTQNDYNATATILNMLGVDQSKTDWLGNQLQTKGVTVSQDAAMKNMEAMAKFNTDNKDILEQYNKMSESDQAQLRRFLNNDFGTGRE